MNMQTMIQISLSHIPGFYVARHSSCRRQYYIGGAFSVLHSIRTTKIALKHFDKRKSK